MRAFLLDHAAATPIPCHRAEGLGASLTLHLSFFVLLAGTTVTAPGGGGPTLAVTYISDAPLALNEPADGDTSAPETTETPVEGPASGGSITDFALALPEFEFDISKVGNAADLFPFLTDPLLFLDEVREKYRETPDRLFNPFGRERTTPSSTPPLIATDAQLQRLVDGAWSRRERWSNFAEIAGLLTKHDPHEGDAYVLMRHYLDENLLQPYYDTTTRDPRFWVMLGLAADHARLVDFIGGFVREHPSSRTTTELLFMLDEFAQASRDTLLMLLSTDPGGDLTDTRDASLRAFDIARRVHRQYGDVARDRGLRDTRSVRNYFDDVRLRILRTIIETTPDGYGAADARFLAGRILWEQNNVAAALDWWKALEPDGRDAYVSASSAVARELLVRNSGTASAISRILGAEYRRWLEFSEERLRQFGYEFDTF